MKENTKTIKKHFRLSPEEAADLKRKAQTTGVTESSLIRILLKGYEPREKPDERFYAVMREISAIGNNIGQLAAKGNAIGFADMSMLKQEALRWHKFQADIESVFLRPTKSNLKWK